MINCKICTNEYSRACDLGRHLRASHSMSAEDYYKNYILLCSDLKCSYINCQQSKKFKSLGRGFSRFCSSKCANKGHINPNIYLNKKNGKLTVVGIKDKNNILLECKCECGIIKNLSIDHFNRDISCGCSRKLEEGQSAFNATVASYKKSAELRQLSFELSHERLKELFLGNCFYCDSAPGNIKKSANGTFIYNGIDRIDSNKGYVENNCVSCCSLCNYAKQDLDLDKFLDLVTRIYNFKIIKKEHQQFGLLVEQLSIANIKLYNLCSLKDEAAKDPGKFSKDELVQMAQKDIELCRERAKLKSEINRLFNGKVAIEEIKDYGK